MNQTGNKRGGLFSFLSILILAAMFAVGVYMIYKTVQTEQSICDHQWNDGAVIREATCTEYGEKVFVCKHCYADKQEKITPSHSYFSLEAGKEATCTDDGYSPKQQCRSCGDIKASETLPALLKPLCFR